jgi:hypothetical protein
MAYLFLDPLRKIVVDGKSRDVTHVPYSLSFSPDGTRVAYVHATVCLDGTDLPLTADRPSKYLFSPDGRTFALFGQASGAAARGLFLDGELVVAGAENAERPVFTPDSKHLLWVGKQANIGASPEAFAAYVDGRPVVTFRELINTRDNWEMAPAGVVTFVARAGDALNRFRITPSASGGVDVLKATAKTAGAPKLADLAPSAAVPAAAVSADFSPAPDAAALPAASNATDPSPAPTSPPSAAPAPAASPAAAPAPDPVAEAAKKASGAIDATANKAKAWLESLKKKKN